MSTRSTTHFIPARGSTPRAIVYRHTDGYPEGAGTDLYRFFAEVEAQTQDTRFNDASYLAAKYVVWLSAMFAPYSAPYSLPMEEREQYAADHPLNFLSVGIMAEDPGDAEYRYVVNCGEHDAEGHPLVTCFEIHNDWTERNRPPTYTERPIPLPEEARV